MYSEGSWYSIYIAASMQFGVICFFFFQAEDGIRDLVRSRGLGDVYKRQSMSRSVRRFGASTGSGSGWGSKTGKGWMLIASTSVCPCALVPTCASPALGGSGQACSCLLYTSPSPRDRTRTRMPSSACKKKHLERTQSL